MWTRHKGEEVGLVAEEAQVEVEALCRELNAWQGYGAVRELYEWRRMGTQRVGRSDPLAQGWITLLGLQAAIEIVLRHEFAVRRGQIITSEPCFRALDELGCMRPNWLIGEKAVTELER